MIFEKLVDGKAVPEEEMDLLLDLVGPEVMVDQLSVINDQWSIINDQLSVISDQWS